MYYSRDLRISRLRDSSSDSVIKKLNEWHEDGVPTISLQECFCLALKFKLNQMNIIQITYPVTDTVLSFKYSRLFTVEFTLFLYYIILRS